MQFIAYIFLYYFRK